MADQPYYDREISITNIHLDPENPRLTSIAASDRDALRRMYEEQKDKLLTLAEHIATHGLNPAEKPSVVAWGNEPGQFVALDANRRLAALKLLGNPMLGEEFLSPAAMRRLREWHRLFEDRGLHSITCVVYQDSEDATPWIELMHGGEQGGAGHVNWVLGDSERFRARRGRKSIELQLLDLCTQQGLITEAERRHVDREGISTFRRLVNTPDVRERIGIVTDRDEQALSFTFPVPDVLKPIARILSDIAHGRTSSRALNSREARIGYVDGLATLLPDRSAALAAPVAFTGTADPATTTVRRRSPVRLGERKSLAPRQPKLAIPTPRIRRIYVEATKLDVEDFTNAAAVLFRVFLELTVDHGIKALKIPLPPKKPGKEHKLRERVVAMATELEKRDTLDRQQARAVKRAVNDDFIGAGINVLQQYVHSPYLSPQPRDLVRAWDNLQVLFEKVWA